MASSGIPPLDAGIDALAAMLHSGELTATALADAMLTRIDDRNGGAPSFDGAPEAINAWVHVAPDTTLRHAADADRLARVCAEYFSRFGREVDPATVVPVTDVGVGVREVLARVLPEPSRVVYTPPVYMPFAPWIRRVDHTPVAVPLLDHDGAEPRLDLAGIEPASDEGNRLDWESVERLFAEDAEGTRTRCVPNCIFLVPYPTFDHKLTSFR